MSGKVPSIAESLRHAAAVDALGREATAAARFGTSAHADERSVSFYPLLGEERR
jgi:hypothetical protein